MTYDQAKAMVHRNVVTRPCRECQQQIVVSPPWATPCYCTRPGRVHGYYRWRPGDAEPFFFAIYWPKLTPDLCEPVGLPLPPEEEAAIIDAQFL